MSSRPRLYDDLDPAEAVLAAWSIPGRAPAYHEAQKDIVRRSMPLLGHALDRLSNQK